MQDHLDKRHQIFFIRGGEAFDTKEQFYDYLRNRDLDPHARRRTWHDWLAWSLSERFEAFTPAMPNKQWADYEAWRIWFERYFAYIHEDADRKIILIGHSLGGLFLTKYLSENMFPKKIHQLHLVAPVFSDEGLVDETVNSFELNVDLLPRIQDQAEHIFFYHSKDDDVVPYDHSLKYVEYIPQVQLFSFEDRGHFRQPAFLEILQVIDEYLGE